MTTRYPVLRGDSRLPLKTLFVAPPTIDPAWVEALMSSANSPMGLRIVAEPDPATQVDPIAAAMWPSQPVGAASLCATERTSR